MVTFLVGITQGKRPGVSAPDGEVWLQILARREQSPAIGRLQ